MSKGTANRTKMDGTYRVAIVRFIDGDKTIECACYSWLMAEGDKVLVKTESHGFGVAEIVSFVDNAGQDIYREIVCLLHFEEYNERLEKRKRKAEIMKQMEERAEKLKEMTLYQTLANSDEEMAALLNEYMEVSK